MLITVLFSQRGACFYNMNKTQPSSTQPLPPTSITSACTSAGFPHLYKIRSLPGPGATCRRCRAALKGPRSDSSAVPRSGSLMWCYETEGPLLLLQLHTQRTITSPGRVTGVEHTGVTFVLFFFNIIIILKKQKQILFLNSRVCRECERTHFSRTPSTTQVGRKFKRGQNTFCRKKK